MTVHEEMTKSRLALEKALVSEKVVAIADAIDERIRLFILLNGARNEGSARKSSPPSSDKHETCPRCLESIIHTPTGQVRFEDNGSHHSDRACAERCARKADKCRDALYEIAQFLNMSASSDPPHVSVPRGVREYLTGAARTVLVDGVVYGESMIRELREKVDTAREKGIREAIELVEMNGPDRGWRALVSILKELL